VSHNAYAPQLSTLPLPSGGPYVDAIVWHLPFGLPSENGLRGCIVCNEPWPCRARCEWLEEHA
jgi:hypothetical protein